MAARPFDFIGPIMKAMESLKYDLGTDVMAVGHELYSVTLMLVSLNAMTLKIIQDLAPEVVTDAALAARLAVAVDTSEVPGHERDGWPGWLVLGVSPSLLAQYGADETDSPDSLRQKILDYNNS